MGCALTIRGGPRRKSTYSFITGWLRRKREIRCQTLDASHSHLTSATYQGRNSRKGQESMSEHVDEVSDSSFENDVLQSDKPVLVDFWAAWCAPCRMLTPTVEAVAEKYAEAARGVKSNV